MPSRSKMKRAKRDAAKQRSVFSGQGHGERTRLTSGVKTNFMPTFDERLASRFSRERTQKRLVARLLELAGKRAEPAETPGVEVHIEREGQDG